MSAVAVLAIVAVVAALVPAVMVMVDRWREQLAEDRCSGQHRRGSGAVPPLPTPGTLDFDGSRRRARLLPDDPIATAARRCVAQFDDPEEAA